MTGYARARPVGHWLDYPDTTYGPVGSSEFETWDAAIYALKHLALDPRDYSVTFDGVTDDTSAWNTFLAARSVGEVIVCPPGLTSRVTANISASSSITGLVMFGWGSTLKLDSGAASGTTALTWGPNRGSVVGLTVDCQAATNSIGIRPGSASARQKIENCHLLNAGAAGVYTFGSNSDLGIANNTFSGGGYGVLFDPASTATRTRIIGNDFTGGSVGDAIEVNTPSGGASDITIVGNSISGYSNTSGSGIGIGIAKVVGATVANNDITTCGLDGIHIEDASSAISVTGNRVTACSRAGISAQIGAGSTAPSGLTILGNTVTGCCSSAGTGAIALEGATPVNYSNVSNNIVRGNGRAGVVAYGIDLGVGGTGNNCIGNQVSNTVGTSSAGIRWNGATDYIVAFNKVWDDQATKTQEYGLRAYGTNSQVLVIGNHLSGNKTGPIDETSITAGSTGYLKRYNRPTGVDNAELLPVFSGAISDASFGTVIPNNGAVAIDQTNGRMYFKYNNAWHYVNQTA